MYETHMNFNYMYNGIQALIDLNKTNLSYFKIYDYIFSNFIKQTKFRYKSSSVLQNISEKMFLNVMENVNIKSQKLFKTGT